MNRLLVLFLAGCSSDFGLQTFEDPVQGGDDTAVFDTAAPEPAEDTGDFEETEEPEPAEEEEEEEKEPPEDEPPLPPTVRAEMLTTLKALLRTAATGQVAKPNPPRRLNRFQYNYTVRDLFRLNRDVFALSEKLMTRETIYLNAPKVPDHVNVRSLALNPAAGLREVRPFPQDLRASHGFDNQANQLTLSPLLFDAFLRLSVSVVESPDFNENTVGIWNTFYKAPAADADVPAETRQRIADFLQRAFRGPGVPSARAGAKKHVQNVLLRQDSLLAVRHAPRLGLVRRRRVRVERGPPFGRAGGARGARGRGLGGGLVARGVRTHRVVRGRRRREGVGGGPRFF